MRLLFTLLSFIAISSFAQVGFKAKQNQYPRVRSAYVEKAENMTDILNAASIDQGKLNIYIRIFKHNKVLELWGKNTTDTTFKMLKVYDVCRTCGKLGPKRKEGDLQIPEGFYHIDAFNPASSYYLSMRVNYPNKSDKILGNKARLGGNICIHGACVTIGCVPITDEQIKELYIFCIEAKNNGQQKIPVSIFPSYLTTKNYNLLKTKYHYNKDMLGLWTDLKSAYDIFNKSKQLPSIQFLPNGRHIVK